MSKIFPETKVQKAIVAWFKIQYPKLRKHIVMIGNGGKRTVQAHRLAKAMGEQAGASDLFLAVPVKKCPGLWIEVKPDDYRITISNRDHHNRQLIFIEHMKAVGYGGVVVRGIDEGIAAIKKHMGKR